MTKNARNATNHAIIHADHLAVIIALAVQRAIIHTTTQAMTTLIHAKSAQLAARFAIRTNASSAKTDTCKTMKVNAKNAHLDALAVQTAYSSAHHAQTASVKLDGMKISFQSARSALETARNVVKMASAQTATITSI